MPAELTRHLLGRYPPAYLADLLLLQDRLAIDGILEPFERPLQMLDPRLERLESPLPTDRRPQGLITANIGRALGWHSQNLPTLWWDIRARGRGNETQRANAAGPAGSINSSSSAPRRNRASVASGPDDVAAMVTPPPETGARPTAATIVRLNSSAMARNFFGGSRRRDERGAGSSQSRPVTPAPRP
jgi:hypothetical protein